MKKEKTQLGSRYVDNGNTEIIIPISIFEQYGRSYIKYMIEGEPEHFLMPEGTLNLRYKLK